MVICRRCREVIIEFAWMPNKAPVWMLATGEWPTYGFMCGIYNGFDDSIRRHEPLTLEIALREIAAQIS